MNQEEIKKMFPIGETVYDMANFKGTVIEGDNPLMVRVQFSGEACRDLHWHQLRLTPTAPQKWSYEYKADMAIRSTYGAGINPEYVGKMYEMLVKIHDWQNVGMGFPYTRQYMKETLASAKL